MNAEAIARALTPHPARTARGWMVPCVAHDDRDPSLSVAEGTDGRILVNCFAGCPQDAVIAALRERGLWGRRESADARPLRPRPIIQPPDPGALVALECLWGAARSAAGTIVKTYLRSRCITIPPPPALRYSPHLRHRPSGHVGPVMLAAVHDVTGAIVAVHRTWLAADGSGKAEVSPSRMMLGRVAGGAVRLAPATDTLCLTEGIETGLSVQQATEVPVWATCGTSGMVAVILPPSIRRVYIAADNDPPGERAAREAAARFSREGREVRIVRPPAGVKDFNDVARGARSPGMAA